MRRVSLFLVVFCACVVLLVPTAVFAGLLTPATDGTEWDFTAGNYDASFGSSTMSNWGTMASNSGFGTSAGFGGPAVPGKPGDQVWTTNVTMRTTDGLAISTGAANGGGVLGVNQFTLIMDVMSVGGNSYRSFFNAHEVNAGDNDFSLFPDGSIGLNSTGGNMSRGAPLTWYRIAASVDAGANTVKQYIDGVLVNTEPAHLVALEGRYSPSKNSQFLLFADNDSDLGSWFLSSAYYTERTMSGSEIGALGGVQNGAIFAAPIPEPSSLALLAVGLVGLLAYAWRKRR